METLVKNTKKFNVGDVIVDTVSYKKGKVMDFPEWFNETPQFSKTNSYYIRWIEVDYDLNVEYDEETTLCSLIDYNCEEIEYLTL